MTIQIKSFAGFNIQDATYRSVFPYEANPFARSATPIVLPVIGGYARDEGFDQQPASFHILINVSGALTTGMDALKRTFRAGASGELVVAFDGVDRTRTCRVESVYPWAGSPTQCVINLIAADPRWRALTATSVAHAVTASGQQWTVTNAGNAVVDDAVFKLTLTTNKAAANSQLYRRHAIVANRVRRPLSDWPIDITNGGINHAALVTAVKSLTSANDVRLIEDGVEIPRYPGEHANTDPNSANTKFWATPAFQAGRDAHLLAAITAGAPATGGELLVQNGELGGWPDKGFIVIESSGEVVSYSGIDHEAASFTGIKRGQRGSTAASASAGNVMREITKKLELVYGWTGAPAPEARPDRKPLFNLASDTLTNIRHEWLDWWDDLYPARPGVWSRVLEPRDSQSAYMYANRGSPAATADILYSYYNPPGDRDPVNVIRRSFPTGTSGAAGQIVFNRVVDATLMAQVLAVYEDGGEHLVAALNGPLTSANFTSAFTQKCYELGLYVRSQTVLSTPEVDGAPLADYMGAAWSPWRQVNAINATGNLYSAYVNDTSELLRITALQVLVWQPGSPKTDIKVSVRADDGSGAPSINVLGDAQVVVAAANVPTNPAWVTFPFTKPWPWGAGQTVHVNVSSGAASSSNTLWGHQPIRHANAFPMSGVRFFAVGEIFGEARAEGGGGTLYAPAAPENVTFDAAVVLLDSAAIPYFALLPEQACYWLTATLKNNTTGQSLSFNLYASPGDDIEIDCGRRTVTNLTTGEEGLIYGMTPSDKDLWITLAQGGNQLQLDETGLVAVTVTSTFKAAYE